MAVPASYSSERRTEAVPPEYREPFEVEPAARALFTVQPLGYGNASIC
jgi:hypothetical protein